MSVPKIADAKNILRKAREKTGISCRASFMIGAVAPHIMAESVRRRAAEFNFTPVFRLVYLVQTKNQLRVFLFWQNFQSNYHSVRRRPQNLPVIPQRPIQK